MIEADVQQLVSQLQRALGLDIVCGSLTLNINERQFSTYDYKVHGRVVAPQGPRRQPSHVRNDGPLRPLRC